MTACWAKILEHCNLQDLLVMVSSRVSFMADVMRTGIGKLPCQSPFSCSKAKTFSGSSMHDGCQTLSCTYAKQRLDWYCLQQH